jgi:hypothetical protein
VSEQNQLVNLNILKYPVDLSFSNQENMQQDNYVENIQASHSNQDESRCYLPTTINIPKTEDGSYTPPPIHSSLVKAVGFASNQEFQSFCEKYDRELDTFTDAWPYNENGECGNWQNHYTKLHKKNMELLDKYRDGDFPTDIDIESRPRFISYICKEVPKDSNRGCGGLADRMGGKSSQFLLIPLNWAP